MKHLLAALIASLLLMLSGCIGAVDPAPDEVENEPPARFCNGMAILCERTYDDVTFPETHNSFATHDDGIYYPASNHATGLQSQWDAGMRAFMLDTHYATQLEESAGEVMFCHGDEDRGFSPCQYGSVEPSEWLGLLYDEMEANPDDVVTLLIENHVQSDHLEQVLNTSLPSESWYDGDRDIDEVRASIIDLLG